MNRTSNLNKNTKAKPVTPKSYDYTQVETVTDSFGHSSFQVHNRSSINSFTSANNDRQDAIRNGGPSNSTTSGTMPKTGKDRYAHGSFRAKESDNVFPKSHDDNKPKYHFSYSKSYNDDGRGNSNQPPTKSPLQGSQSSSKSYLQGKKRDSVNSDTVKETTAYQQQHQHQHQQQQQHGNHKGKLITEPFVPQSQGQNGQHRNYASTGGRQQQQQQQHQQHQPHQQQQQQKQPPQSYYSSGAKYQSTSPILTVGQSPVSIHVHPHSISYTSTTHHGHYSYSQTSPQPIHPQLSPSLPSPSAPIPIPHSWTAPGIPHYYAVPSPVYDSQHMQYHQYHPQYHHHSPHTTPAYTYYPNQSLPAPGPQSYQNQQAHQPTSPSIHQKSPSQTYTAPIPPPQNSSPSARAQPRTSKAIPIINPDTMTPVQADVPSGHPTSNSNSNKIDSDKKENGKLLATMSAPTQFIDPAIKEQEEREQQEREEQEHEMQVKQQQQAEKKGDHELIATTPDDVMHKVEATSSITSDLQKVVEITSIGSNISPKASHLTPVPGTNFSSPQHASPTTTIAPPSTTKSTDNNNADADQDTSILPSSTSLGEKDSETGGVIQYDPAFLMQFMPLCLDTAEDLSSFQNILDSAGDHGRYNNNSNNGGDKRQHFGNSITDRNNTFRPGGNNNNKNYSRSAPGGISILANQMTATHYQAREGRPEMGKFIGGRTLTGRNNNNITTTTPGTTISTTSSNINNLINASINNATAFGGDSSKMQRDGSFGGRTKYTAALSSGRGPLPNSNNNNNNKRYGHHDNHHNHHHHHYQQCGAPTIPFDQVVPLEKSANRWVPSVAASTTTTEKEDEGILSQEEITRKIKALLNKLTLERFDTISDRIIGYAEQSTKEDDGQSLRTVIQLIFEKACDEAAFASMWAQLCRKLYEWIPADIKDVNTKDKNGEPVSGIPLYCKYLFSRCQYEFEKGWKSLPSPTATATTTTASDAATVNGDDDGEKGNDGSQLTSRMDDADDGDLNKNRSMGTTTPGEAMMTEEYYTAVKIKRQGLGLVQFIGELYCRDMLSQRIMYECLKRLCDNGAQAQEEEVESLCKLLTTIGADIDRGPQTATWIEGFFKRMQNEMYNSPHLSSRVKFMIMDVIDLRKHNWVPRNGKQDKPKTIAEIHEDAEKAKLLEKEALAKRSGSSRGGGGGPLSSSTNQYGGGASSRQNYRTNGKTMKKGNATGLSASPNESAGWNMANSPSSSMPRHNDITDYSNFGRTERARPKNNNLVPSYSPFASLNRSGSNTSDDGGSAQKSTIRRKPSSTLMNDTSSSNKVTGSTGNMVSALGGEHIEETEQRKKLTLLPRGSTLQQQHSVSTEQKQTTSTNTISKYTSSTSSSLPLDNAQLKRRIKNTLTEYFELADIEELFTSIEEMLDQPETQAVLAMELIAVVEMKEKQVIAVGGLIPQLYKADLLDKHIMVKTFQEFMHGYEDLVIDVPQAPTYVARLLVQAGIGLSDACDSNPPTCLQKAYTAMLSS